MKQEVDAQQWSFPRIEQAARARCVQLIHVQEQNS